MTDGDKDMFWVMVVLAGLVLIAITTERASCAWRDVGRYEQTCD